MELTTGQQRRAALGSFVGAVVEWYDFLLYGLVAALVLNSQFFPGLSPAVGTLSAFATVGVGFLFRPMGGAVFGHFGDKLGPKRVLTWTMTLMGIATVAIGVLPTFGQVGLWAPLLLTACRALQGFAVGGEWGGAALLAVRAAPKDRQAFFSSGVQVGYSVGLLLSTGAVTVMNLVCTDEQFLRWGWRVPFLVSAVLIAFGLWVRLGVVEMRPEDGVMRPKRRLPFIEAIAAHPTAFFAIIGVRLAEMFSMYIVTTFGLAYSVQHFGWDRQFFLNISLVLGVLGIFSIPAFAYLSDRVGRKPVYVTGALVVAAATWPFFKALESGNVVLTAAFAVLIVSVGHDMVVSVQQPMITKMFGKAHQYSGAGLGYQVAAVFAGGFTPFIAQWIVARTDGAWQGVAWYLIAGAVISALTVGVLMRKAD
ncbi:shikimate transporter [Corynebacterium vitaeruminis]|uniref:shikimate transporter n=1 Tax=Corynebacterium vitaeruminis TaxID=38305 RepID=UPI00068F6AD0|nr:shikimate transporter [Corynebacterium vitaeruminis]